MKTDALSRLRRVATLIKLSNDSYTDSLLSAIKSNSADAKFEKILNLAKNDKEFLKEAEKAIVASKNPEYATKFAIYLQGYVDLDVLEHVVVSSGEPEYAYSFAKNVRDANIKALEDVIAKAGNLVHVVLFAKIKGADIKRLEKLIADSGNSYYAYNFAKNIPNADIPLLEKVVIENGSPSELYLFAKEIPGANLNALDAVMQEKGDADERRWIQELQKKSKKAASYSRIVRVARVLEKLADLELSSEDAKVIEEIIAKNDYERALTFAIKIQHLHPEIANNLVDLIIKSGDPKYSYKCAMDILGLDKDRKEALAKNASKSPYYAYSFAKDVPHIDINPLEDAVIKSGDIVLMKQFLMDVVGADKNKFQEAIASKQKKASIKVNPLKRLFRVANILEKLAEAIDVIDIKKEEIPAYKWAIRRHKGFQPGGWSGYTVGQKVSYDGADWFVYDSDLTDSEILWTLISTDFSKLARFVPADKITPTKKVEKGANTANSKKSVKKASRKPSKENVGDWNQHKIMVDLVKNPDKRFLFSDPSMTAEKAEKILRDKFQYTDSEISRLKQAAAISKKAEDDLANSCNVPNLDAMSQSELMSFWKKWHRATKKQAVGLVGLRKDADKIAHTLAAYAVAKAVAMDLREKGNIDSALKYEQHCDIYYDQLPEDCIW